MVKETLDSSHALLVFIADKATTSEAIWKYSARECWSLSCFHSSETDLGFVKLRYCLKIQNAYLTIFIPIHRRWPTHCLLCWQLYTLLAQMNPPRWEMKRLRSVWTLSSSTVHMAIDPSWDLGVWRPLSNILENPIPVAACSFRWHCSCALAFFNIRYFNKHIPSS